jgi:hypothetical protein
MGNHRYAAPNGAFRLYVAITIKTVLLRSDDSLHLTFLNVAS